MVIGRPVRDVRQLLELARASAEALRAADVPLPPAPAPGWLVMQRVHRQALSSAAADDASRGDEALYEQIWLTADGELRTAWRVVSGTSDPDTTRPGAVVSSLDDIGGSRWGGEHGEDPTTRIATGLRNLTERLIDVEGTDPSVGEQSRADRGIPAEFVAVGALFVCVFAVVFGLELLWSALPDLWRWFVEAQGS